MSHNFYKQRFLSRVAVSALLSLSLVAASTPLLFQPVFAKGPDSLAPLAEQVIDAVVNIKANQTSEAKGVPMPKVPGLPPGSNGEGSPLDEFFNDFFNQRNGEDSPSPRQRKGASLGSGFVIDSAGIVITNNHVIDDANQIFVVFNDGTELKAELIGKDPKIDIAVLRVKPLKPLKAVKFGDSSKERVGDPVMAIGNPYGFGGSVSAGIVSAINRNIGSGSYDNYIQTDAAINKGNSGGPLFNMDGEVIGINTAIISPTGGSIGIGFAVPSKTAIPIIDQLQKYGETRRGWLGVRIQDVDDGIAESLDLGKVRGAFVAGIDEKGPAKSAGLEDKDIILKFDGKEIKTSRDLPRLVAETSIGTDVELLIFRKGKEITKTVKLGRLEEASSKKGEKSSSATKENTETTKKALGLDLGALTSDIRRRFGIRDGIRGVAILRVDGNSRAAEKRVVPGDVIIEVGQEPVSSPSDVTERIEKLKAAGKKVGLFAIANAQGDLRYVPLAFE
jgi:serine protease Do